jgi:hypothetical protein
MESSVKAAMLKSSQVLASPGLVTAPASARGLRRVQSGSSLNIESPRTGDAAPDYPYGFATAPSDTPGAQHSRGVSVDILPRRPKSRSGGLAEGAQRALSPVQFVSLLTGKSSIELEVDVVKKLRLLLRNEAARCILLCFLIFQAGADERRWCAAGHKIS